MVDRVSEQQRSYIMSQVGQKNTAPEKKLRELLYTHGLRGYRVNFEKLPGRPDIAFTKYKLAIFVDGCFWHGCSCRPTKPETNKKFWEEKFKDNRKRDRKVDRQLKEMDYSVLRFWEHEIDGELTTCFSKIYHELLSRGYPKNKGEDYEL